MFDSFWTFLKDPANRVVLGWICGGGAAVVGGGWALFKFFASKNSRANIVVVKADRESVAIGRDSSGPINVETRRSTRKG